MAIETSTKNRIQGKHQTNNSMAEHKLEYIYPGSIYLSINLSIDGSIYLSTYLSI